jgi:predicted MFS family arabinose efflux permease
LDIQTTNDSRRTAQLAFRFVVLIGIVNFFADFTYEGGRSVTGPFLATLGATAATVGFVAGFGEMLGYALRSLTGFLADKTHKYWAFALVGYAVNMLAVPALALAGNWQIASLLMIAERTGRAIRKPSVDTMLSYAAHSMGRGWVFGLNEALDQAGATLGPLVVAFALYAKSGYRTGFAVLLVSATFCLSTVVVALLMHPRPHELETREAHELDAPSFSKPYWLYLLGGALVAAGFADFSLISFHFEKGRVIAATIIPIFYSAAMAAAAVSGLLFGWLLDRLGFKILILAFSLAAFFAPLTFSDSFSLALLGTILWGLGLGAQELLKAELTSILSRDKRSSGFGVFDAGFGIAWFLGSWAMGLMYEKSIASVIFFSVVCQLAALPVFYLAKKSGTRLA